MRWLVTYDITDNKLRARTAKVLMGYGHRVQYSVFECELNDAMLRRLVQSLENLVPDHNEGLYSVRLYPISKALQRHCKILGSGDVPAQPPFFIA